MTYDTDKQMRKFRRGVVLLMKGNPESVPTTELMDLFMECFVDPEVPPGTEILHAIRWTVEDSNT